MEKNIGKVNVNLGRGGSYHQRDAAGETGGGRRRVLAQASLAHIMRLCL